MVEISFTSVLSCSIRIDNKDSEYFNVDDATNDAELLILELSLKFK